MFLFSLQQLLQFWFKNIFNLKSITLIFDHALIILIFDHALIILRLFKSGLNLKQFILIGRYFENKIFFINNLNIKRVNKIKITDNE